MEWPMYLEKERFDTLPRFANDTTTPSNYRRASFSLFRKSDIPQQHSGSLRGLFTLTPSQESFYEHVQINEIFPPNKKPYHQIAHIFHHSSRTHHKIQLQPNTTYPSQIQSPQVQIQTQPQYEYVPPLSNDFTSEPKNNNLLQSIHSPQQNNTTNFNYNYNYNINLQTNNNITDFNYHSYQQNNNINNSPHYDFNQNNINLNTQNNINTNINPSDNFTSPTYDYSFLIRLSTHKLDPNSTITIKDLTEILNSTECFSRIVWYSCLVNGKKLHLSNQPHSDYEKIKTHTPTPGKKREHKLKNKLSQSYHRHTLDFRSKLSHISTPTFIFNYGSKQSKNESPLTNNFITREPIISCDNIVSSASGEESALIENAFRHKSSTQTTTQPIIHYIVQKKKALCKLTNLLHHHTTYE